MLGALVYSELGTTIVRSGGDYAYLKAGFGSFVSFLYLWINLWVIRPAGQAILALATATYLLEPFKSSCQSWDFDALTRTISILLVSKYSSTYRTTNPQTVVWAHAQFFSDTSTALT